MQQEETYQFGYIAMASGYEGCLHDFVIGHFLIEWMLGNRDFLYVGGIVCIHKFPFIFQLNYRNYRKRNEMWLHHKHENIPLNDTEQLQK